jgi:Glycosyl hydrolase family 30 beta sandwich domain
LVSGAKQQKYYSLAHFSRWIHRGDKRITASADNDDVLVTAFKGASGTGDAFRYTVVLINSSNCSQDISLDTVNIRPNSFRAFITSYAEGKYLQPVSISPTGKPHLELPAHAVATVLIN